MVFLLTKCDTMQNVHLLMPSASVLLPSEDLRFSRLRNNTNFMVSCASATFCRAGDFTFGESELRM